MGGTSALRSLLLMVAAGLIAFGSGTAPAAAQFVLDAGTIDGATQNSSTIEIGDSAFIVGGGGVDYSTGTALSADGTVLVGSSDTASGHGHAFAYTAAGGMVDLGALSASGRSGATGVSSDGSVIVGLADASSGYHAFVYSNGTMTDIGTMESSNGGYSFASGVSWDGTVVVGASDTNSSIDRAFVWTQSGGFLNLGLISGSGYSDAYGVSGDGTVVVGWSGTASGYQHAFAWSNGLGMSDLGTLGNVSGTSVARAADMDGAVIVGQSITASGDTHAFIWNKGVGMTDLGTIGGSAGNSGALAVDGAGTIVVGYSAVGTRTDAFLWTQSAGMQDLNALMAAGGVDMTGIVLTQASGISSDGQFVGGTGTFGSSTHAFLARVVGGSGLTTPASILASINALAASQQAQMITQTLLDSLLVGRNEQVNCSNCAGGFASVGSLSLGVHGRHSLTHDLTVLGGIGYTEQSNSGSQVSGSWNFAASLRYDFSEFGSSRPYVEFGGQASPWQRVRYTRSYVNGAGIALGIGTTDDKDYGLFGRVGWLDRISPIDELAANVSVSRGWQYVGAYAEAAGANNPFDANASGGWNVMNVVSAGAQYTRLIVPQLDGNVNIGVSRSFGSSNGDTLSVAGAGSAGASVSEHTWGEYGLSLGYYLNSGAVIDAFILGTAGPKPIGYTIHGGLGVRLTL
jgi:probable HAF family extracellular repeat protein